MGLIKQQTISTMKTAIVNFAEKEFNCIPKDVQLVIAGINEEELPAYKLCYNYKKKREVRIDEIIAPKNDVLGIKRGVVPEFLKNAITRISKENECEISKIELMIVPVTEKADDLAYFLYIDGKLIKRLSLDYILGEE